MQQCTEYIIKENFSKSFELFIFKHDDIYNGILFQNKIFSKSLSLRYTIVNITDIIDEKDYSLSKLLRRYKMSEFKQTTIKDEDESFSNDDLFNINSWGADLSFRELIAMYDENDLIKPTLQRKYVWKIDEASRLIDSILLGLPIPSIFLAKKEEKRLIIDGYQRIKTVYDFVNGIFTKNNKMFRLSNSKIINARWRGKSFLELSDDEQRRIKNTTIHAIIFEQKKPDNDSGMYQIFERINTSGRTLYPQEIRNCIYQGLYNDLLMDLNRNEKWRAILNCDEDSRMSDVENILRYFSIRNLSNTEDYNKNQIILKKFLNDNMALNSNLTQSEYDKYKSDFTCIINKIFEHLGKTAFNNISDNKSNDGAIEYSNKFVNKFHPTIFEAVMISFQYGIEKNLPFENMLEKQLNLLNDSEFKEATTIRTTNVENIKKRISLATRYFFGVEYEWK